MDIGLVQGVVAAGALTTPPGKHTFGHPTTHRLGATVEVTHPLGVGPEERVGMDTPRATYTTSMAVMMSSITQQWVLVKAVDMGKACS